MKITAILLMLLALFSPTTPAQDYSQLNLPEGAVARLGKGRFPEIQYSPDGTRLAVASTIGIWLYDTNESRSCPIHRTYGSGRECGVQHGWEDACQWELGRDGAPVESR